MSPRILLLLLAALTACEGGVVVDGPVTTGPQASSTTTVASTSPDSTTTTTVATTSTSAAGATPMTSTGPTSTTLAEPDAAGVVIYLLAEGGDTAGRAGPFLVPVHRPIPSTAGVARAAIGELLEGPTGEEETSGMTTAIPPGVVLLGVAVADGTAVVDLSGEFESGGGTFSMQARLAQLVYTLTRFPTVDRVELRLDGEPVDVFSGEGLLIDGPLDRSDYLDLVPTILVDDPAHGATVSAPLRVQGTAAVFEATFQLAVLDVDGTILAQPDFVMTDNGTGWGSFDVTLDLDVTEPTTAVLRVWNHSAADGSVEALREHRITVSP